MVIILYGNQRKLMPVNFEAKATIAVLLIGSLVVIGFCIWLLLPVIELVLGG